MSTALNRWTTERGERSEMGFFILITTTSLLLRLLETTGDHKFIRNIFRRKIMRGIVEFFAAISRWNIEVGQNRWKLAWNFQNRASMPQKEVFQYAFVIINHIQNCLLCSYFFSLAASNQDVLQLLKEQLFVVGELLATGLVRVVRDVIL